MPKHKNTPAAPGGQTTIEGGLAKPAPKVKGGFDPASLKGPKGPAGGKGLGGRKRMMLPGRSGNR